jgi:hypothetical protein
VAERLERIGRQKRQTRGNKGEIMNCDTCKHDSGTEKCFRGKTRIIIDSKSQFLLPKTTNCGAYDKDNSMSKRQLIRR